MSSPNTVDLKGPQPGPQGPCHGHGHLQVCQPARSARLCLPRRHEEDFGKRERDRGDRPTGPPAPILQRSNSSASPLNEGQHTADLLPCDLI